jgi:enoyl-CoA hydratase/carnithine racemase
MSTEPLVTQLEEQVLTITFQRPKRKNALTLKMYELATAALEDARDNEGVRVVVFRGAGGTFTSGNDLNDFVQNPPTDESSPVFGFLRALRSFPKPIVGVVQGYAVGIGTTMLLHCDLILADTTARFQLPFIKLALVPEAASSLLLPRLVGYHRAAELLMLGEPFGAQEAHQWGLVSEVHSPETLDEAAAAKASALASQPPEAMRLTKQLLKAPLQEQVNEVMTTEAHLFAQRLQTQELADAIARFFNK